MRRNPHRRPRVCIVATAPATLDVFMLGHLIGLAKVAEVTAVADFAPADAALAWPPEISRVAIRIARPISLWIDLLALFRLFRLFRRQRFDLVHSITPKAGLLAMFAGALAGVPLRLHSFTGQVWVTRTGPMRALLKNLDRLIARLATSVLVDSPSQREFLIVQGVVAADRSTVIARGSICGVDTARFRPDSAARERVRRDLRIPADAMVFVYLGRVNRDKGLLDLATAFTEVGSVYADAHLLVVGPDEDNLSAALATAAAACSARLHRVDFTDRPQDYFAAADVFCLPSYREGFGSTIIEAAAAGVPAIGSRIYGITDAIVEGESGLLFEAGNANQLAQRMLALAGDASGRRRMGQNGRERALRDFSAAVVTAALLEFYEELLAQHAD